MVAGTPVNLSATCSNRDTSRAWMLSNISFWFPSRSLDVYAFSPICPLLTTTFYCSCLRTTTFLLRRQYYRAPRMIIPMSSDGPIRHHAARFARRGATCLLLLLLSSSSFHPLYEYTKARFSLKAFLMFSMFPLFQKESEFTTRLEIDDATNRARAHRER